MRGIAHTEKKKTLLSMGRRIPESRNEGNRDFCCVLRGTGSDSIKECAELFGTHLNIVFEMGRMGRHEKRYENP